MVDSNEDLPRPAKGFRGMAELRITPDKGIGVFATQFIPANTWVYEYEGLIYSKEKAAAILESMSSKEEREYWLDHVYGHNGKIILLTNDGKFVNHSDDPNVGRFPDFEDCDNDQGCTLRDIREGEELTEDYNTFLDTEIDDLAEKFDIVLFDHTIVYSIDPANTANTTYQPGC